MSPLAEIVALTAFLQASLVWAECAAGLGLCSTSAGGETNLVQGDELALLQTKLTLAERHTASIEPVSMLQHEENFTPEASQLSSSLVNSSVVQLRERMNISEAPLETVFGPHARVRYFYQQSMMFGTLPADLSCPLYASNTVLLNMGEPESRRLPAQHPMLAARPLNKAGYNEALGLARDTEQGDREQSVRDLIFTDMNVLEQVAYYCLDVTTVLCWPIPTSVSEILECGREHCTGQGLKQCGFTISTERHSAGGWFEQDDDSAEPEVWFADSMSEDGPRVIGGAGGPDGLANYVWKAAEVDLVKIYQPLDNFAAPCNAVPHEEAFCEKLRGQQEAFGKKQLIDHLGVSHGFPQETLCHWLRPGSGGQPLP